MITGVLNGNDARSTETYARSFAVEFYFQKSPKNVVFRNL